MDDSLPPSVEVVHLPGGGVGCRLHDPPVGLLTRLSGLYWLLGGLFGIALAGSLAWAAVLAWSAGEPISAALLAVLTVGPLLMAAAALRTALFRTIGCHRRIEVGNGRLRVVEWLGPVRRTASRRLDRLRRLDVGPDPTPQRRAPGDLPPLTLVADCTDAPLVLASARPRDWLVRLATHLRRWCAAAEIGGVVRTEPVPLFVHPDPGDAPAAGPPPATARATAAEREGVLTLFIDPPNLRHVHRPALFFGLLFLVLPLCLLQALVGSGVMAGPAVLVPLAIGSAGLFFAVKALRIVSTRAVVAVDGRDVDVTERSWFGVFHRRWPRSAVAGVDLADSNLPMAKGGPTAKELRLRFTDGSHRALLAGRDERELRWLATVLQDALRRLPVAAPPRGGGTARADEVPPQPPDSRAVLEWTDDGFRLTEPPLGWTGRLLRTALVGLLLAAAGATGGALVYRDWAGASAGAVATAVGSALGLLVGGAVLLEAVTFARLRRLVVVTGETLHLRPTAWWGDRERTWRRDEITAVDVGPRPAAAGGRAWPPPQLRIHTRKGRPQSFLAYHEEREMLWVAALLRRELGVPAEASRSGGAPAP